MKKYFELVLVVSLALTTLISQIVPAATFTWNNSDGFWQDGSSWSPSGVPGSGDDVIVSPYGGVDTILNFTSATGNRSANSLLINSDTASTIRFLQTGGSLTISYHTIGLSHTLGSVGSGNYMLSGGSLSAENEIVGFGGDFWSGYGVFTQSGGTHTVTKLNIGLGTGIGGGGDGSYTLSGGNLSVDSEFIARYGGYGSFTQNGGMHVVSRELVIGQDGYGNYTLSAGSLLTDSELIGSGGYFTSTGSGSFTQSGGTHTVTGGLILGSNFGSGSYTLSAGGLSADSEILGNGPIGSGTFTQRGGLNMVSDILSIGYEFNSDAKYDLSAGSLSAGSENIGYSGTLNQTGGINTAQMMINNGAYNLTGGTFVVNGSLDNSGTMNLAGGTTTVNGNVTNAASGKIEVAHSPAIFTGDVVNNGQFKSTHATVTFTGSYTENGAYISDPSINNFTNLIIGSSGYLAGGQGNEWHIAGSFENHSLQNTLWNTVDADLFFDGSGMKDFYLAGANLGASKLGFSNNFAFGSLHLASGVELTVLDGNVIPGAAMYVDLVSLGGGIGQLSHIHSDFNIYYDPAAAGNEYLLGKTYALDGSGVLAPAVPEPETYAMLLFGLSVLGFAVRRREQIVQRSGW